MEFFSRQEMVHFQLLLFRIHVVVCVYQKLNHGLKQV